MSATEQPAEPNALAHAVASKVRAVLGLLLLGMVVLNVTSAMCRYIFGIVFVGADELLVFTMIWMVMVGMIVATASRSHIALDFLVTRAAPRQRVMLSAVHNVVMTGACGYATVYCWSFVMRVAAIGQTSMALELPMAIPHFALVVGFGGTTIASALLLASDVAELARGPRPAAALHKVGAYRFDDPAGEVGIETIIVSVGNSTFQVPLTYRAQPLAGAESWLVGTMQHSVLGPRWVYDACADPIYVAALAASIMLGRPQAEQYLQKGENLELLAQTVFVRSTGPKLDSVPDVSSAAPRATDAGTAIETADLHLLVIRRLDLDEQPAGPLALTGTWEGQKDNVKLAAISDA